MGSEQNINVCPYQVMTSNDLFEGTIILSKVFYN